MITDAPKESIEQWCGRYAMQLESGTYGTGYSTELFDTLKTSYYVKELYDSEISSEPTEIEIIGYDEIV